MCRWNALKCVLHGRANLLLKPLLRAARLTLDSAHRQCREMAPKLVCTSLATIV
mgnify:CR=1 FL=1